MSHDTAESPSRIRNGTRTSSMFGRTEREREGVKNNKSKPSRGIQVRHDDRLKTKTARAMLPTFDDGGRAQRLAHVSSSRHAACADVVHLLPLVALQPHLLTPAARAVTCSQSM